MKYEPSVLICIGILCFGAVIHFAFGYTHPDYSGQAWGSDDAFISYRYARNLANGDGLVFNPGNRPVEGYSNFLYTVLMSIPFLMGEMQFDILLVSFGVNLLFAAGTLFVLNYYRSSLGLFLFATSPILWVAVASGLETSMVLFLQVCLVVLVDQIEKEPNRRSLALCILTGLILVLTRADGFVASVIVVSYLLLKNQTRIAITYGTAVFLGFALFLAWRHSYYGFWLPNTYYVKVSSSTSERLIIAAFQFFLTLVLSGIAGYLALFILYFLRKFRDGLVGLKTVRFEVFFSMIWLAYWLYVGGDVYFDRFLVIIVPLGIVTLVRSLDNPIRLQSWGIVALIFLVQLSPIVLDPRFEYSLKKYDRFVELGNYLGDTYPEAMIAIDSAGKTPYFSQLKTIDILGLNDLYIAHHETPKTTFAPGHSKFDPDYVLSQSPDFIIGWVAPCDKACQVINLEFGMTKEKYKLFGYAPKYVLNTAKQSTDKNIIDVSRYDDVELLKLINGHYRYVILAKQQSSESAVAPH